MKISCFYVKLREFVDEGKLWRRRYCRRTDGLTQGQTSGAEQLRIECAIRTEGTNMKVDNLLERSGSDPKEKA